MKVILLIFLLSAFQGEPRKSGSTSPTGLMVEFIREPRNVALLDPEPEFSWIVPDLSVNQSAYQIMVASDRELLLKDKADFWNSEKKAGSASTEISYAGSRLPENSTCYWKVRIWGAGGKPSSWSDIQSFRTGIFQEYGTTPNLLTETRISPVIFRKTSEGNYFIDFGKDAFAKIVLDINPVSNDTIIVRLGEKLSEEGTIDREPGGSIRYYNIKLPVEPGRTVYSPALPRDPRNTGPAAIALPDSVGIIAPFRYCELENCNFELKPENISQHAFWHYFDDSMSYFQSSDTILNRIWEICKYTIKATSFAGLYIDGDRERIPYEADAYINQLGHYYTDREYSIARRTNEYFINHPTWPTEWILQTPLMFFNDLLFTGNTESVEKFYINLHHKTLVETARHDGLISSENVTDELMLKLGFHDANERIRDIVDWPPSQKDTGWKLATPEGERDGYALVEINTVVNAFHYRSLVVMSEIAGYLGKSPDSLLYAARAEKVKKAINEKLLDPVKGIYLDGESSDHSSLHANMMPLAFGIVPEEHTGTVVSFIKSRGMACSVYGAQFLLEGLFRAGEAEYAIDLITATHDRSWWNMVASGSTMTMEAWDMKYKPNSDWNHAWGAAPANIIPGYMWGIRPAAPGYGRAVIKPLLGDLRYSLISVPTIRGNIVAEFRNTGSSKEYMIIIPANMECDFIPGSVNELTKPNLRRKRNGNGIIRLKPGTNRLVF